MKIADQYLAYVEWSDEDKLYIGYCPDLFPFGGVCHGKTPAKAYARLREIMDWSIADDLAAGRPLPPVRTRPRAVKTKAVAPVAA